MASSIKDKSVLIYDFGMGCEFAQRLGREFGKVGYFTPWQKSFPDSNDSLIGEGFDNVTREMDFWQNVDKYDMVACFDTHTADVVEYLRSHGKMVFGAGRAELLELNRWKGRKVQQTVGLPIQNTEKIIGLTNLKKRLAVVKNKYVKLSLFRGAIETFFHKDFDSSEPYLDKLAVALGAKKNDAEFIIEDPVEGSECGSDTFVVDGKYPAKVLYGWEVKDKYYVGKVTNYNELYNPLKDVTDKLSVFFEKTGARSMFSTEIKINGEKGFLIDPTVRAPFPPSFVQMELYSNFGEFIFGAAMGQVIPLENSSIYGVEVILGSEYSNENLLEVVIPPKFRRWVKLSNGCKINDKYYILPGSPKDHGLSVVGVGNTVNEAIKNVQNVIDGVDAFQLEKSFDKQAIFDKIAEGKKQGIPF
jgi:hypothetical protein